MILITGKMRILFVILLIAGYIPASAQSKKPKKPSGMVFEKKENAADFPGGDAAWARFAERNFNFSAVSSQLPDSVLEFTDSIYVQFVVSKDSVIEQPKTTSPKSVFFKEEVLKLLKKSPKWIPAFQGSRTVKAYKCYLFVLLLVSDTGNIIVTTARFPEKENKMHN
jgi:hypothetical protein